MHSLTARQPMDYTHTVLRLIIYLYTLDLAATAAAVHHSELAALMIYSMLKEYVYMYVQLVLIYIYIYIYIYKSKSDSPQGMAGSVRARPVWALQVRSQ
jgi:hypothetical protein